MRRANNLKNKKFDIERKVDDLERRLRDKIDVKSGFSDPEARARKLANTFKYFDKNNSGVIDIHEFISTMTQLNFVGVQSEIEGLFNRFDDDASGTIDYREFANYLFGVGTVPMLDNESKDVLERVKAKIIELGGANGIHSITAIIKRLDIDGSKTIDRDELGLGIRQFGIDNISPKELDRLFNYFDRDRSGRISADEFLRGLKTGMSLERKQIVREAFRRLDRTGDGYITIEDILQCYDTSTHPSVSSGTISPAEAAQQMLAHYEQGHDVNGVVTWPEFLDYYKGLSLAIEDDNFFDLMIRNAWHIGNDSPNSQFGTTTCRRVLVIHTNGRQEVVEISDDLGIKKFDRDLILQRLQKQGIRDIADVQF